MPQKPVALGTRRRVWNYGFLCALRNWDYVTFFSVHWKEGRTIRKCIKAISACDYNEKVLDFGMASSTKLFLIETEGNMIGLLKLLL